MRSTSVFQAVFVLLGVLVAPPVRPAAGQQLPVVPLAVPIPDEATSRRLVARRATAPVVIDGSLNDAAWQTADIATDFVGVRPDYVLETPFRSTVRILFDDEHLYIGAVHLDSAGLNATRIPDLRRDFTPTDTDVFGITIGSLGDGRTVYQFQVTPLGSQGDVQAFDGGAAFSFSWDAMWRVRTSRSDSGWVAELAIPWTSLRYTPGLTRWNINFVRNTRRALQWTAWVPYPRQFSSWRITYSGILDSIAPPPPRTNVRTRSYALTESESLRAPSATSAPWSTAGAVGGEVIWAPSANSLVEATVNTDFAQADVDRQVVNLTRFSVFFPEQRQFFLENADLLTAGSEGYGGMNSPSVGYVVRPFFSRRIGLGADGTPRNIIGGARYGYRTGSTSAGVLAMRQRGIGDTNADAATIGVARGSRFIGRSTRVGALAAYRLDESDDTALGNNMVTAVDALTRIGEQVQLSAMFSTSTVNGRTGYAATWAGGRSTPTSAIGIQGALVTDEYRPQTGFVSRPNVLLTAPSASYTWQPAWRPKSLVWIKPELTTSFFHDPNTRRLQEGKILASTELYGSRGGAFTLGVEHNLQRPERAVPLLPNVTIAPGAHDYFRYGISLQTDPSAALTGSALLTAGAFFDGHQQQAQVSARWSPSPFVAMRLNYEVNALRGLGERDTSLTTHLAGPEVRVFLTPRVQWSAFYQYNSVVEQGSLNARFSWEFAPLSFLYVVYNGRQPILNGIGPRAQSLIVKLSWLKQM